MRMLFKFICVSTSVALAGVACSASEGDLDDAPEVIENYAANVHANYADSLSTAGDLKSAIDAFVAAPSEETLEAARSAWLAAREPYGQTEVFRFYDGPIDNPTDGPEGLINSWPLDEAFIDYVVDDPDSGIINDPSYELSKSALVGSNGDGGEDRISTGYHAIEFLLWGQDLDSDGPGYRPYTDYVSTGAGTAANQERRAQYLTIVGDLLVENLTQVTDAWAEGGDNYRAELVAAPPREALRRMLLGMGSLAGAELSGERLATALDDHDQEDEHSCFSDNTHRDLRANALAIQNVYLGRYGDNDGPGIDELVAALDPELDARMKMQLEATNDAIAAIPVPFDQAIMSDEGRAKGQVALDAILEEADTIVEIGTVLGIDINVQ